jgi:outer membrane protein assembly factor BamB
MIVPRVFCATALAVAWLGLAPAAQNAALDYTQWRGPNRDGATSGFIVPTVWPETLARRWKIEVGLGYATPLVVGNRVYVFSRRGENEVMTALDISNGEEVWQNVYPVSFTMNKGAARHGPGPKSTPVFSQGKLFSIGMTGIVTAFNAETGKQLWQKRGSALVPTFTTHSFSPVVDRGLVIFHPGGHDKGAITAFDVNTGAVKWSWDGDGPGYGSPVIATIGGTRQLIALTQGKLVGLNVSTGGLLWERAFVSNNFTNSATPVVADATVIVSNGGPVTAFTITNRDKAWVAEEAWTNADVPYRLSNPVVIGGTLFGLSQRNSGQYFAVDVKSGKTLWTSESRQAANAAIAKSGTVIFSLEDDGELVVLLANTAKFEEIRRYKVAETDTWTQPAISGNRIFVKDVSSLTLWTITRSEGLRPSDSPTPSLAGAPKGPAPLRWGAPLARLPGAIQR